MLLLGWTLALLLPSLTESLTISLQSTNNITISIKRGTNTPSPPCFICAPNCKDLSLDVSSGKRVDYTFSCKTPEMYYIMEINRTIDCSSRVCPLNISLQPPNLEGLNRTYTWNILTSTNNGLVLGFPTPSLRQIHPSSLCPDLVSYKISTYSRDSSCSIGTFCQNGTVTRIKVQERGAIALSLPWNVNIKDPGISIANRSSIRNVSSDELYHLDLTKESGLVVRIGKKALGRTFAPECVICKAFGQCSPELVLDEAKYYKISFLCGDLKSLVVTAEKKIECWNLTICKISNMLLNIAPSLIDFPVRLESYTWKLIAPEYISTEIVSKSMYLQQNAVDKKCNMTAAGFTYDILSSTNKQEFKIGTFCPNGSIEKIQLRDNVTITLNMPSNGESKKLTTHDLYVSFVSFIKEECIFTVSPKTEDTIYLQTPHWDYGLPDYVSVSWSINMPKKQFARLKFGQDMMDINCEGNHAYVKVKEEIGDGSGIERREDQQLPGALEMYSAFWVNISNCKPWSSSKKLKLSWSITFSQVSPVLKIILIAACSAIAVVLAVIATICCIKNKKKQTESPVGIYNSKVNTEAPRRQAIFKKGRKTNESHIYAVIDDTMVYGHLLQETTGTDPEVDVYRPFEGAMGDAPPVPPITFPNGSTKEEIKDGSVTGDIMDKPLALSMKDNEIYVFSQSISRQPVENEDTSLPYIDDSRSGSTAI
ncbi:CUB domain-containing protein 1-like isoform X2 [Ranitomeya variabilis]|uniref:CUB domain-containing protein 1-like isoform X2 n=1 Tax=Ranitomeya variabilis TaxID=490064 RepID=UPI004056717D